MRLPMRSLHRFIVTHRLHQTVPVDLSRLHGVFQVSYVPFSSSTLGCSLGEFIAINCNLHPYQQRMVLAHEISHQVLHHPNALFLYEIGHWWYDRIEMEAQRGAAAMLVPFEPLLEFAMRGATSAELEEYFEVPGELIELRLKMAK